MIHFKSVEADDIRHITAYLSVRNFRTCDFSIGGIFMWREYFKTSYAVYNNCLFFKIKYFDDLICFTFPIGHIPDDEALTALEHYVRKRQLAFNLCTVPEEALEVLRQRYPDRVIARPMRDWFDYLYKTDDLIRIKGKKYGGFRNHINQFEKTYSPYAYQQINGDNIDKIQQFLHDNQFSLMKEDDIASQEYERSKEILSHFELFNLVGGCIELSGKVIGFTVGEVVNDTLFIHIEKALIEYHGVYPLMVNAFVKQFNPDVIQYVNREEDVGNPGLRKSKLSYHPIKLLSKYLVTIQL